MSRSHQPSKCRLEDGREIPATELKSGDVIVIDGGRRIIEEVYEDGTAEWCWLPADWPAKDSRGTEE